MARQGTRGRPARDYKSKTFGTIEGLTLRNDGRWQVRATGYRFSAADEGEAILKFNKITGANVTKKAFVECKAEARIDTADDLRRLYGSHTSNDHPIVQMVPEGDLYAWFKSELERDPVHVAKMMGVPTLAFYKSWTDRNTETAKLAKLWGAYQKNSTAEPKQKTKTKTAWERFVKSVGVERCDEITIDLVKRYKSEIKADQKFIDSTRMLIFQRVKAVVNAAADDGIVVGVLSVTLQVLTISGAKLTSTASHPMKRNVFEKLVANADVRMKALLLVAMNAAMYGKECCDLYWEEIDLDEGTIVTRRNKTSIIRAAKLWPETIEALHALRAKRPNAEFVFTSQHGGRWNEEACRKTYKKHRERCDIPSNKHTQFQAIRDAAYTVAARKCSMQETHVLAGHKVGGLSDRYIAKNPMFVEGACQQVRLAFVA